MNFAPRTTESPASQGSLQRAGASRPYRPDWVPQHGTQVVRARGALGVVRLLGARGTESAEALCEASGHDAGPILQTTLGPDTTFFIVEHIPDLGFRWPPGIRELGAEESLRIPAYGEEDALLEWLSRPTLAAPFVDRKALRDLLIKSTGWAPVGDPQ